MAALAPSRIVILGNTGSIGNRLFHHFQSQTNLRTLGYSSKTIDLRKPESVNILSEKTDQGTVLIVASGFTLDRHTDSLEHFIANTEIAVNVARFLETCPIAQCIYLSTVSVYGDEATNLSINEETPINPITYYAAGKYAAECILKNAVRLSGTSFLNLRLCRAYGPGVRFANYGPVQFIRSIFEKGAVELYGDGHELRDLLYIDDLCRLVEGLIRGRFSGVYNLASGKSYSFSEILAVLKQIGASNFEISHTARSRPLIDQKFNISKLLQKFWLSAGFFDQWN